MRPRKGPILPLVMHKIFDGLTEEELTSLTLNQFEEHQKEIMRRKALDVTVEGVVHRLDRAPALGEFKDTCKSLLVYEEFFFNKEQIQNRNVDTPGAAYFKKVCEFYNAHYTRGKLYLKYVKDCCETRTGHQCQFCQSNPWTNKKFTKRSQE